MTNFEFYCDCLQLLANLVIILSVPITIHKYFENLKAERIRNDYNVYNDLDNKYIDFVKMCINHPELNIFEIDYQKIDKLQDRQVLTSYAILMAIFERSYYVCVAKSEGAPNENWIVWSSLIDRYCDRKNFKEAWDELKFIWDPRFVIYIENRMKEKNQNLTSINTFHL